jgi:hypothetical protein
MKGNQKSQTQGDPRSESEEIKLDRRYGDIGISAVAAALQHYGERHKQPVQKSTARASNGSGRR